MRLVNDHVRVTVPATSANLGPGYDCMGLALGLRDTADLWATTGPTRVEVTGVGAGEVPTGSNNLVAAAAHHTLDVLGTSQVGLHISCVNRIPHGSGLGSSAAAIVAGIQLARGLVGPQCLTDADVLQLATEMEGHPDNVAPAIFGGVTLAWMGSAPRPGSDEDGVGPDSCGDAGSGGPQEDCEEEEPLTQGPAQTGESEISSFIADRHCALALSRTGAREVFDQGPQRDQVARVARLGTADGLACTVLVPKFRVSTEQARRALPMEVPHEEAAFNVARASLLALILAGVAPRAHLMDATADALHQDYRRPVMPATMALVDLLRDQGYPAVISGAGPSVLVLDALPLALVEEARAAGWQVERLPLESSGAKLRVSRLGQTID